MDKLVTRLPKLNKTIKLSKGFLKHNYRLLETAFDNTSDLNFLHSTSEISYTLDNTILNFSDFKTVDPAIRETLQNKGLYYRKMTIMINDRKYIVQFFLPCLEKEYSVQKAKKFFNKSIKQIYLWLYLVQEHIKPGCSNILNINIVFSEHKKRLGQRGTVLSPIHVNSAFTTSCMLETNICIYRKEEWFKVFIHETFHCLGLDFSGVDNSSAESLITGKFKVQNHNGIRVYESYCEIWAEVMNVVICSFLRTNTQDCFMDEFNELIHKEMKFSLFQMVKSLNYHNIRYIDILDSNCKTIRFQEETHVLSYYILKTILFYNLSDFEKWCKTNNITLLQFDSTNNNIVMYIEFIKQLSDDKKLIKIVSEYETYISEKPIKDDVATSMRMSINEF